MEPFLSFVYIIVIYLIFIFFNFHYHSPECVIATEGGLVTLSCQYNTSADNAYLYWYKQVANDFPKHMLSRYSIGSGDNDAGFKERFNASLNTKTQSVPLTIQRLQLSDSAVYYCALQKHCVHVGVYRTLGCFFTIHKSCFAVCYDFNFQFHPKMSIPTFILLLVLACK
uniref:Ig-like domain-containing protein n=1 Tax=Hucho hucho TaxID=62062 RepID=A0A4W5K851_9TELE